MPTDEYEDDYDPLDTDDYDPIDHLNQIFPTSSALTSVSQARQVLPYHQDELDAEIDVLEEAQDEANAACLARMRASQAELAELFVKIENVRQKAAQTERNITEMTRDIKQLDNTKKNLTLSMTVLKRLQMLTTAYDQLKALVKTRQYKECAQLLQAVIQLTGHFKSYRSVDQIATLSRNVVDLQRELLEQVCEDFEITFSREEVPLKRGMLHEACLVVDALGDQARSRLITWYCNTELRQYRTIFRGDQEAGSLDNIDRRYAWFRKTLKSYDEEHAAIFPQHWHVGDVLAHVFAESTREDYKGILSRATRNGQTLDVRLLLTCLQQTLDFEHNLERRLGSASRTSFDTRTSEPEPSVRTLAISEAFEPYLGLWVDQQDKELARLISEYASRPARPSDEEVDSEHVMPSSTELIKFYQVSLAQCAKLSTGQPLLELSKVFARHLESYSQRVLLINLSEKPNGGTSSRMPQLDDIIVTLNTADYVYSTVSQLEERIKNKIDPQYTERIDLSNQADVFMGIASAAVRALVRLVEVDIDPSWREMRNTAYGKIESCTGNSSYIPVLQSRLGEKSSKIVSMLHKQQYARAFADNLVELISSTYLHNVTLCRPIAEAGAEQMLLDAHEIRKVLSTILPGTPAAFVKRVNTSMGRVYPLLKTIQVHAQPPEALVQAYLIHIADLSEVNFRKIIDLKGIRNKAEQSQLVELFQMHKLSPRYKGTLVDQSSLLTPLMSGAPAIAVNGVSTPAPSHVGVTALQNLSALGNSAAASLSNTNLSSNLNIGQRFSDASGLGSAFIDRFSGSAGVTAGPNTPRSEGAQSPPPPQPNLPALTISPARSSMENGQNGLISPEHINGQPVPAGRINENLKNFGKFFKRDIGSFSGMSMPRFGNRGTSGSQTPQEGEAG